MATTDVSSDFAPADGDLEEGSYRPALVKLVDDVRDSEHQLLRGFGSRREVLLWTQELAVRTLGEMPQEWFHQMARQFRGVPASEHERTLVSALLRPQYRTRDLAEAKAREFRRQLSARTIRPAAHRAFRELRADAGEYVDDGSADQHAPGKQQYVAMRPAIHELHENQRRTLKRVLDGFEDREAILDWGHDLELATHGEIDEAFVTRCYGEQSTRRLLTGTDQSERRGRELFAAHYLIPVYNRGVRDLAGRAKEQADEQREERQTATL
ncbi:hypothetical protein [Halorubrum kocurii]|uniref:Uncharacterized protein n=1 Tax=Halorubrum kocurii JCM 14978 TaxID=1230456 RepID=M0NQM7_9EURY|nr:hypothetical protein [Halorubrum kocurii]EMA59923.1 hypothetical protein C468_14063 [Halorubrum kocurii JCM 14978]